MITNERLATSVRNTLEVAKDMKKAFHAKGETSPHLVHLLDHLGRKQVAIGGILSGDGSRESGKRVKSDFKRSIKKSVKKFKSHGIITVSDAYQLDDYDNRTSECLVVHGETKRYRYTMMLPYVTFGTIIAFDDEHITCVDDAEGDWTGYFRR
jgi:hypothetical protein